MNPVEELNFQQSIPVRIKKKTIYTCAADKKKRERETSSWLFRKEALFSASKTAPFWAGKDEKVKDRRHVLASQAV